MAIAAREVAWTVENDESRRDLVAAFEELAFVASASAARLERADCEIRAAGASIVPEVADRVSSQCRLLVRRLRRQERDLARLSVAAVEGRDVETLASERFAHAELLRADLGLVAALVTATDWQSPSFGHSLRSAAGRQTGLIEPHRTDYKRDRHLDAAAYERAYVGELVGDGSARALLTSCGMSAFTTILGYLVCEGRLRSRHVLIGRGLYHETRQLLHGALPGQIVEVDEFASESIVRAVELFRPAAVFVDSVANTSGAPVIDLEWLVALVAAQVQEVYLVVDATGTTVAGLPNLLPPRAGVRLLLFESLLKYCQFGVDRANAGVVVAWGADAEDLARYREHLGTNVPDVAVHALPPPNRQILLRRLARLERNARIVAERLQQTVEASSDRCIVAEVVAPLLPRHPSHAVAAALPFAGSCLALRLEPRYDEPVWRERLLARALAAARGRGVSLIAGSSFGFDTTRIYVTADSAEHGEPFVRIAVGTEHRQGIEAVADALSEAVAGLAEP